MRFQDDPAQIIAMTRDEFRISGEVSFETSQQTHAEQIRQCPILARPLEHSEHPAVGCVDSVAGLLPLLKDSVAPAKLCAVHKIPIVAHAIDHTDFVAIL